MHEEMRHLYSQKESAKRETMHIEKNVKRFLIIIISGSVLSLLTLYMTNINPVLLNGTQIEREECGGRSKNVNLYYKSGNSVDKKSISITVSSKEYPLEEIEKQCEQIKNEIPRLIKGENNNLDHVDKNLYLPEKTDSYPFSISWKSANPLIVDRKGNIDFERLEKELKKSGQEGFVTTLSAEISYEEYKTEIIIPIQIFMPELSSEAAIDKAVKNTIANIDKETRDRDELELPQIVNGEQIIYSQEKGYTAVSIIILAFLAAFGVYISSNNEITKRVKDRNEQLEMDYPRIINRYALYYSAGMHTKAVWREICSDYRKKLSKGGERRYVFEEMLRTEAAMADGVGDMTAYNEFASNCGIRKYRHFVSLIEQSLKKGKEQMGEVLLKEADDAVNERLAIAKIKGEEAATKLLLPMFMMLLVVLIIVIVPAFVNFNV